MSAAETAEMPVVFVSHGSPMLPFEDIPARKFLLGLAAKLPRPKAVLCISAHWESPTVGVTGSAHPETIHDFYGFPKALYELEFDAPGSPELAAPRRRAAQGGGYRRHGRSPTRARSRLLESADADLSAIRHSGGAALADRRRRRRGTSEARQALAPLRKEGVLIFASGGAVHNLRWLDRDGKGLKIDWAEDFDRWVGDKVEAGDTQALAHYRDQAPNAALAHPSDEHFLPLLVAMGAANGGGSPRGKRIHDSFNLGKLVDGRL